jgi:NADH-quinone oxidoreductase subunit C
MRRLELEYSGATDRFEVVYLVLNVDSGERLTVKTYLNEPDLTIPSATSSLVLERIGWSEKSTTCTGSFSQGHPNFKRLFLPQEFQSFPCAKITRSKGVASATTSR